MTNINTSAPTVSDILKNEYRNVFITSAIASCQWSSVVGEDDDSWSYADTYQLSDAAKATLETIFGNWYDKNFTVLDGYSEYLTDTLGLSIDDYWTKMGHWLPLTMSGHGSTYRDMLPQDPKEIKHVSLIGKELNTLAGDGEFLFYVNDDGFLDLE